MTGRIFSAIIRIISWIYIGFSASKERPFVLGEWLNSDIMIERLQHCSRSLGKLIPENEFSHRGSNPQPTY